MLSVSVIKNNRQVRIRRYPTKIPVTMVRVLEATDFANISPSVRIDSPYLS